MRKIVFVFFVACIFTTQTTAQHFKPKSTSTPQYFTILTAGMNAGKDYSGSSEKNIYGKIQGVYSGGKLGLAYHAVRVQPLSHKTGREFEQYTVISLGAGKIKHLEKESKIIFGVGPTVVVVPRHGVTPKVNDFFYGGTIHGNYVNGVHIGADMTFAGKSNPNEWNKTMGLAELEAIFFFNKVVGIKAMYGFETSINNEKQIPGMQFNQNRYSHNVSNLTGGICLRFRPAIIFFGPSIRTEGQKYSFLDQYGTLQKGKSKYNPPMGLNLSLNFHLEKD